ncbi:MAG: acetate--CoA ligase family protein [Cryobacterium sp.]|nr:acetate--CoA ligase family protein [Cryobacterium sp.]
MTGLRSALFNPKSVALFGASDNLAKTSARPLSYLRRNGWKGQVYPINPFRTTVLGEPCWPSLEALPEVPDHVYVVMNSEPALDAIRECVRLGVPVVSVLANGFNASSDEGARRVQAVKDTLAGSSTRLLGPSSLGIANPHVNFCLTGNAVFAEDAGTPGGVFVASQSGSLIGALLSRGRESGVGFAGLVSTGNEIDLTLGEICQLTLDDPSVTSYALFLESMVGAESLQRFAQLAAEAGRSVLVYKLGRSEAAARLSVGHTGAVAGDDAAASAFFREYGMGRTTNLDALLDGQHLGQRLLARPSVAPPRVIVVTTTGGGGAMVVDQLGLQKKVALTAPSETLRARLAEAGIRGDSNALVDLELSGANHDTVSTALRLLSDSEEFDVIVAVAGSSARNHPELVVAPIAESASFGTPIAAFVAPHAPEAHKLLQQAGISAFRSPEACADAIHAATSRWFTAQSDRPTGTIAPHQIALNEVESYRIIERTGISIAEYVLFAPEAVIADPGLDGPFVVKAISRNLPHKSEAGGVIVGIKDWRDLDEARTGILRSIADYSPDVAVEGVLVQRMVDGLFEVLLGYRVDPDVGPIVAVGVGGIATELFAEATVALAPVDEKTARRLVDEIKSFDLFRGYRSRPRGDVEALVKAIVSLSNLAVTAPEVIEAEINPLFVLGEGLGVSAVDSFVSVGTQQIDDADD